jgi:2-(1,2-epoxy-1,2-dihydrophenyl)acetyl-CoA isomerase
MSERIEARRVPGRPLMTDQVSETASAELTVTLSGDHVATLEFSRPPNNFFSLGLITALADACDELAAGGACRAIVLCSAGRVFCAGADFASKETGSGGLRDLYDAAERLFAQPLPIVAAVQGAAVGGGLGLALAADFRVASPDARFAANFALLGIHPGFALSLTLPAVIGQQAALELLYTGRRVRGDEAVTLGLADQLAAPAQVREEAHALAARIAAAAPLAVRSIRQTVRGPLADQARAAMARERAEQERLMHSADWREGQAAVRDRRPARFTGQ